MLATTNSFYIIKCNGREFNAEDENVYEMIRNQIQ